MENEENVRKICCTGGIMIAKQNSANFFPWLRGFGGKYSPLTLFPA